MDEGETIPLRLRGKRNIIFGNLLNIYHFHDEWVNTAEFETLLFFLLGFLYVHELIKYALL